MPWNTITGNEVRIDGIFSEAHFDIYNTAVFCNHRICQKKEDHWYNDSVNHDNWDCRVGISVDFLSNVR